MFKWLIAYIKQFGKDFPLTEVQDKNEYEIVRILQECCETNAEYPVTATETATTEPTT